MNWAWRSVGKPGIGQGDDVHRTGAPAADDPQSPSPRASPRRSPCGPGTPGARPDGRPRRHGRRRPRRSWRRRRAGCPPRCGRAAPGGAPRGGARRPPPPAWGCRCPRSGRPWRTGSGRGPTISGSQAALWMTVRPGTSTAAQSTFAVPVTVGPKGPPRKISRPPRMPSPRARMYPPSTRSSAPSAARPVRWRSTGRGPITQPPGKLTSARAAARAAARGRRSRRAWS